jgi:hypothetical protein
VPPTMLQQLDELEEALERERIDGIWLKKATE